MVPVAAKTVTALRPRGSPSETECGSQGLSSSNSPNTIDIRPGIPCCTSKSRGDLAPSRFMKIKRTARPMVALARVVMLSISWLKLMSSSRRIGPLKTSNGAHGAFENALVMPHPAIAPNAARSAGKYCGAHPAITALAATLASANAASSGPGIGAAACGSRPPNMALTRCAVGAMTGSPSDQPRSSASSHTATGSSSVARRRVNDAVGKEASCRKSSAIDGPNERVDDLVERRRGQGANLLVTHVVDVVGKGHDAQLWVPQGLGRSAGDTLEIHADQRDSRHAVVFEFDGVLNRPGGTASASAEADEGPVHAPIELEPRVKDATRPGMRPVHTRDTGDLVAALEQHLERARESVVVEPELAQSHHQAVRTPGTLDEGQGGRQPVRDRVYDQQSSTRHAVSLFGPLPRTTSVDPWATAIVTVDFQQNAVVPRAMVTLRTSAKRLGTVSWKTGR